MKIAHVVTYVSRDGSYGGPTRVALGQAEALAERGHEVTVYAASPPDMANDIAQDGYRLCTFPAEKLVRGDGFAYMHARGLTKALRLNLHEYDIVHLHLARDLVMIPAALAVHRSRVPYVLQTHGMVDSSKKLLAKALDIVATRKILKDAKQVLVLTDQEEHEISKLETSARTSMIRNGIKVKSLDDYTDRQDTVLFLARLQQRKRPLAFVQMAKLLNERFPETSFLLIGPDEGEAEGVQVAIDESGMGARLRWLGPVPPSETSAWMSNARAYVLPAFDEVFPMSILEAFQVGTPVVTTDSLGIAPDCARFSAALITDGSPSQLASAVSNILTSSSAVSQLRSGGQQYLRTKLDIDSVADLLENIYSQ